ncbi:hypothetical protein AB3X52_17940 [Nocardioides sp. DS6]|uniref:HNH endonuclease n=1 Tax=Nocardioides eburneus TaxID=3231482 RepID=A0ABV3T2R0_9ACTN
MPIATATKVEVLRVLVQAGPAARALLSSAECDLLIETCADVARMADDLPGPQPRDRGRAARDGTSLLLELGCPRVDGQLRGALARAVERVVVRRLSVA